MFCIMIYHSSLRHTAGPCCLSILYMLVCIGAVILNHGHILFDTLPMKDGVCVLLKVSSLMTSLTNRIQLSGKKEKEGSICGGREKTIVNWALWL